MSPVMGSTVFCGDSSAEECESRRFESSSPHHSLHAYQASSPARSGVPFASVAQRKSTCLPCRRSWVRSPSVAPISPPRGVRRRAAGLLAPGSSAGQSIPLIRGRSRVRAPLRRPPGHGACRTSSHPPLDRAPDPSLAPIPHVSGRDAGHLGSSFFGRGSGRPTGAEREPSPRAMRAPAGDQRDTRRPVLARLRSFFFRTPVRGLRGDPRLPRQDAVRWSWECRDDHRPPHADRSRVLGPPPGLGRRRRRCSARRAVCRRDPARDPAAAQRPRLRLERGRWLAELAPRLCPRPPDEPLRGRRPP